MEKLLERQVLTYLTKMIGVKTRQILIAGVPQGSVLSPTQCRQPGALDDKQYRVHQSWRLLSKSLAYMYGHVGAK